MSAYFSRKTRIFANPDYNDKGKIAVFLGCYFPFHLLVSSFIQKERRGWGKEGGRGNSYFSPLCFTLLEYIKIWCKIQVIIYPFSQYNYKHIKIASCYSGPDILKIKSLNHWVWLHTKFIHTFSTFYTYLRQSKDLYKGGKKHLDT